MRPIALVFLVLLAACAPHRVVRRDYLAVIPGELSVSETVQTELSFDRDGRLVRLRRRYQEEGPSYRHCAGGIHNCKAWPRVERVESRRHRRIDERYQYGADGRPSGYTLTVTSTRGRRVERVDRSEKRVPDEAMIAWLAAMARGENAELPPLH